MIGGMDYISFYGAVLATVVFAWNFYNVYQDRAKVRVEARFGCMLPDTSKEFLFIGAMNTGKRSVHLSSFGLRAGDDNFVELKITALPCELEAGRSHQEFFEGSKLPRKKFDFAWYQDETGKVHKSKSIRKMVNAYFERKVKEESNYGNCRRT